MQEKVDEKFDLLHSALFRFLCHCEFARSGAMATQSLNLSGDCFVTLSFAPRNDSILGFFAGADYTLLCGFSSMRLNQSPIIRKIMLPTDDKPTRICPMGRKSHPSHRLSR